MTETKLRLTQQELWGAVKDLPDDKQRQVYNFAISLKEPIASINDEFAEYEALMDQAQAWAKEAGLTPDDITASIKAVRQRRRQKR